MEGRGRWTSIQNRNGSYPGVLTPCECGPEGPVAAHVSLADVKKLPVFLSSQVRGSFPSKQFWNDKYVAAGTST